MLKSCGGEWRGEEKGIENIFQVNTVCEIKIALIVIKKVINCKINTECLKLICTYRNRSKPHQSMTQTNAQTQKLKFKLKTDLYIKFF